MSDWLIMLAVIVALLAAGYLLVRYEILDVRDAAAGAGLIAALVFIWRMLTTKETELTTKEPELTTKEPEPIPPTHDVDEIIDLSGKQLSEDPPDDIHERLRNEIERQRREYGD